MSISQSASVFLTEAVNSALESQSDEFWAGSPALFVLTETKPVIFIIEKLGDNPKVLRDFIAPKIDSDVEALILISLEESKWGLATCVTKDYFGEEIAFVRGERTVSIRHTAKDTRREDLEKTKDLTALMQLLNENAVTFQF